MIVFVFLQERAFFSHRYASENRFVPPFFGFLRVIALKTPGRSTFSHSSRKLTLGLDKSASEVTMSSNYLFSYLLETADLPMTGLQKMLRTLYTEYPVISVAGVLDRDGNYINAAAAADLPLIRDYSYMQYNYLVKHAKTASEFYQFHQ